MTEGVARIEQHEPVGTDLTSQHRGRQLLRDNSGDAVQITIEIGHDGNATSAAANHHDTGR